jgi:hypothetical protein
VGGTDYQSDLVVFPQPFHWFTLPASSLSKQFFRLEGNLIPHDEICGPGQVAGASYSPFAPIASFPSEPCGICATTASAISIDILPVSVKLKTIDN